MPDFDLLIRGARPFPLVGILDGKIAALDGDGSAREEIDASGCLLLTGVIDAHVHFNEPGRTDWEGLASGSRAAAAGGTTTFFDMPLNSHPPTNDAAAFQEKRRLAEAKSVVDFALWGGIIPGNLAQMEALRDAGVIGFKAFMSGSGIADFPLADLATLRAGMLEAARLGLPVAVHAEFDALNQAPGTTIGEYLCSRPISSEVAAIRAAIDLAGETSCVLHIVHVSSAAGVAEVVAARRLGADVTCETCPHYLVLSTEDAERLGAVAKCAPPLRAPAERAALLACVRRGEIQTIGSDHSPAPFSMKTDADFSKIWGGISGCQHLLPLLLDLNLTPAEIAALTAGNVADRFRVAGQKGRLTLGADADCVLVDPSASQTVAADSLLYRHKHTPYLDRTLRGRIRRTWLRGQAVWQDGQITREGGGRLVRPVF